MFPKLSPDLRVGRGSFQSPVDLSLAHRIIGSVPGSFVPGSFEQAPWTQIDPRSGLELHPNLTRQSTVRLTMVVLGPAGFAPSVSGRRTLHPSIEGSTLVARAPRVRTISHLLEAPT